MNAPTKDVFSNDQVKPLYTDSHSNSYQLSSNTLERKLPLQGHDNVILLGKDGKTTFSHTASSSQSESLDMLLSLEIGKSALPSVPAWSSKDLSYAIMNTTTVLTSFLAALLKCCIA